MTRPFRMAPIVALLVGFMISKGQAQWGYSPYGWGGWSGSHTVGGDVARGMGIFAQGVGQFNEQTAVARRIEAGTRMELNEYLWRSEQIRRRQQAEKSARITKTRREAANAIEQRILYNPEPGDVSSGNALNAVLHQLQSPSVPDSIIANVGSDLKLTGEQIRTIPLQFASKGIVISAHRLAAEDGWPAALSGSEFESDRNEYEAMVQKARDLPEDQEVPDEKIVEAIDVLERMRATARQRLSGPTFAEAERYLKTHAGLLQMARRPEIRQILQQAYAKDEVELSRAVLFMDVFNLQFGKADDPAEVALYTTEIYPKLTELRRRVAAELGGEIPSHDQQFAQAGNSPPLAAFEKLPWEEVTRDEVGAVPPVDDQNELSDQPR